MNELRNNEEGEKIWRIYFKFKLLDEFDYKNMQM